ncbi:AraC family transcriptional regulator [Marininema halotolerans]|uniref:AraC family transcriptional regulator n=1 Tax=Marininema halotolerans TaxID=1155944 RepID=A0A1I6UT11_9BACL|nr:AraC family transcriptional regulator [Marininema halotolerans]SFT04632.1 AraC family transcriptional regulator [Marininema halotolerans]
MGWIESLQRAIDYMEDHLLEDITIERIAAQANVSPYHFQRTFNVLTDISIGEYLRRRRLTLAAKELTHTSCKIIDLAYKYGYDTPEAFSKAFRRHHGITPRDARKGTGKLTSYNRLVIQVHLKGADPVKHRIVEKEAFDAVGMKRTFSLVNEENLSEIPEFWNDVHEDGTDNRLFQLNNGHIEGILGICVNCEPEKGQTMDYWIATNYMGETPDNLAKISIPASKWVVFEVVGPMPTAMQKTWKQIFSEWFPASDYQHAGIPELEVYSDKDPFSPDYYSEIWIPIK